MSLQENSLQCGLAYIVSIVAEFDEYTNDVLNLNEGSCLPRYAYNLKRLEVHERSVMISWLVFCGANRVKSLVCALVDQE